MLEWLRAADHWLFQKINGAWTHPWLDAAMPVFTDLHTYKVFVWGAAPVLLLWWLHAKRKEALKAILAAGLAVGATDAVNHRLVKPLFARSRPAKAGVLTILRSRPHYGYSFPSNHAANNTAAAVVLRSTASPPIALAAAVAAFLVCYSRVYVGVHFPSDVLAGALVGALIGWLVTLALRWLKLAKK